MGVKEETGAKLKFLLLKQTEEDEWETLVKPAKRVKLATSSSFGEGLLRANVRVSEHGGRDI